MLMPAPPVFAQATPDAGLLKLTAEARLAKIQTDYGVVLSEAQQTRISNLCKTVQSILHKYMTGSVEAATAEQNVHGQVIARMGSLQSLFQVSQIDYASFSQIIIEYSIQLDSFKNAAELHNTLLADTISMDCAANPDGFRAMISATRASRPEVVASRATVRAFLSDTATPAIEQIKNLIVEAP